MAEPFIAQIVLFAGNFAPRQWAFCAGQILPIAQNTALFSLLGTTYGGNGQTTFALPDFRGRVSVGQGTGPGLPSVVLGEVSGTPSETVLITQMPAHIHGVNPNANSTDGNPSAVNGPAGAFPGYSDNAPLYATTSNATMGPSNTGFTGGSQPHNNMQPFLGLNFIIAIQGVFPSRN